MTMSPCSPPKRRWTRCRGIIGSPTGARPSRGSARAVELVEAVLARNPDHPQASHLYIHLMENGPDPKRAEAAADRLAAPLAPARRPPRPHAGAYLFPARAVEGLDRGQRRCGARRRGLYPQQPAIAGWSATAIIRTTSTSSSPRRRWRAIWGPRSARRGGSATIARSGDRREDRVDPGDQRGALFRGRAVRGAQGYPGDGGARCAAALCRRRCAIMRGPWPAPICATRRVRARDRARCGDARVRRLEADGRAGRAGARPAAARRDGGARRAGLRARAAMARRRDLYRAGDRDRGQDCPTWSRPSGIIRCTSRSARRCTGRATTTRRARRSPRRWRKSPNNGWALYGLASAERALGRRDHAAAAQAALDRAWLGNAEVAADRAAVAVRGRGWCRPPRGAVSG